MPITVGVCTVPTTGLINGYNLTGNGIKTLLTLKNMTVKELIKELQKMPKNAKVYYQDFDAAEFEISSSPSYVWLEVGKQVICEVVKIAELYLSL